MSQLQGWLLIAILAFSTGWFIHKDVRSWPTQQDSAMAEHKRQLCALRLANGRTC